MQRVAKTVMLVCATALGFLGVGGSASAQSSAPQTPSGSEQCRVTIDRSLEAGVLDVVLQRLDDGSCVCAISTGPASQVQGVEGQVASIQQSRRCPGARVAQATGPGGPSGAMVGLLGAAGVVGLVGALELSQSDRPASP